MAEELANSGGRQSFDKALGLKEKASDFHWMLQIVALTLFIDCVLLLVKHENLWSYPWGQFNFTGELPLLLASGLAYSVIVSAVIPVLGGLVGYVVRFLYYQFLYLYVRNRDDFKRWRNQVTYYELKEHADRTQSSYARSVYENWENTQIKIEGEKIKMERAAFRVLVMIASGFYLSTPEKGSTLLIFSQYLSIDAFVLAAIFIVGILFYICGVSWCRDRYQTKWITYAPLYDEIIAKQEAEKKKMEDFANESYERMRLRR
ncbi:hypothetical protein FHW83_003308 [Duganella sp. SG902]|uniref:hypothetical protein n=1 Tax=Duganella sp. SG902 TaxID=2587016 RepID=UPI00159E6906|nr:hypothetical protein [Duganella sp. SG902]NVM77490.1 hypothetical protein [Duganella sp. SG902]